MSNWASPQARDWKGESGRSIKGDELDLPMMTKLWTTPQAHDEHGGNADRIRRQGTLNGCANLADDVCGWAL